MGPTGRLVLTIGLGLLVLGCGSNAATPIASSAPTPSTPVSTSSVAASTPPSAASATPSPTPSATAVAPTPALIALQTITNNPRIPAVSVASATAMLESAYANTPDKAVAEYQRMYDQIVATQGQAAADKWDATQRTGLWPLTLARSVGMSFCLHGDPADKNQNRDIKLLDRKSACAGITINLYSVYQVTRDVAFYHAAVAWYDYAFHTFGPSYKAFAINFFGPQ